MYINLRGRNSMSSSTKVLTTISSSLSKEQTEMSKLTAQLNTLSPFREIEWEYRGGQQIVSELFPSSSTQHIAAAYTMADAFDQYAKNTKKPHLFRELIDDSIKNISSCAQEFCVIKSRSSNQYRILINIEDFAASLLDKPVYLHSSPVAFLNDLLAKIIAAQNTNTSSLSSSPTPVVTKSEPTVESKEEFKASLPSTSNSESKEEKKPVVTAPTGLLTTGSFLAKNIDSKPAKTIRCLLDFDGTLTERAGRDAVFTKLYESLKIDKDSLELHPNTGKSYADATFKDMKEMVRLLHEGLQKDENKTMGMSPGAFEFLKKMLEINADVTIITRNREAYIRAILLERGMEEKLLSKLKINDVLQPGDKFEKAQAILSSTGKMDVTVVCDDDRGDFNLMFKAATSSFAKGTTVVARNAAPGAFHWDAITKEVMEKAELTPVITPLRATMATLIM